MIPRGLTLVEMLVALFILAVLATLSYRTVAAMTDARAHLESRGGQWERLVRTLDLLEMDLAFAQDSGDGLGFRGEGGNSGRWGEIRFVRAQPDSPGTVPEAPALWGYRLRDGRLEQLRYPDAGNLGGEPQVLALLGEGLTGLRFRFRDVSGRWLDTWPAAGVSGLPRAVEARFHLAEGQGEVVRVFALP